MMKTRVLITLAIFQVIGCSHADHPELSDDPFILKGSIVDVNSHQGLGAVIVGYRSPSIPDTLLFAGDSLLPFWRDRVPYVDTSSANGTFKLHFYPGFRDTSRYRYLFAYKVGYSLWRSNTTPMPVFYVSKDTDQVEISLIAK